MSSNINHSSRSHALLSASGSKRWLGCPRSALFSLEFPVPQASKFAQEGTDAHELAERILRVAPFPIDHVDQEMLKNVKVYTDYVQKRAEGKKLDIEVKGELTWIHPALKGGTADAVIRGDWDVEVVDLKYGAGVSVSPVGNSQLIMYALMALYNEELKAIDETYETLTLTIVQPRCGDEAVRSWTFPMEELKEYVETLRNGAENAMDERAPLIAGDHCKWCPCAHACPQLKKTTHDVIAAEFDTIPSVEKLTDKQIADVIAHKSVIETFIEACEQHALSKMSIGQKVAGLKLVRGRGSRDWAKSEEDIEAHLLTLASPDDIYESGLKSIAKIEKVIGKKAMEPLTVKKEGRIVVALESDKRPEVTTVSVDDFETIEQPNLLD